MKNSIKTIISGLGLLALALPNMAAAQEATATPPPAATPATTAAVTSDAPAAAPEPAEPAAEPTPEPTPEPKKEPEAAAAPAPANEPPEVPPEVEKPNGYLDPKINIGTGIRVEYAMLTNPIDHRVGTNIRPYINGQVSKHIKFEANLDSALTVAGGDTVATIRILDAVIKLELHDLVNFWVGRFLPPSDRANLSGPYFQNSWNYPAQVNAFPGIYAGRHDGAAYWGQVAKGKLKWQAGIFDATGSDSNPLFAGRVVYNVFDPEGGYYNSSTYYGTKDVLAIAGTIHHQKGGAGGSQLDGIAIETDVLFEKPLNDGAAGTLTVEGAYYNFENTEQGQSFMANLSYLLPGKQGPGTLQPQGRLQYMFPEAGDSYPTIDAAINYIVDGHNCRFTLNYQHIGQHDAIDAQNLITLGGQIQMF